MNNLTYLKSSYDSKYIAFSGYEQDKICYGLFSLESGKLLYKRIIEKYHFDELDFCSRSKIIVALNWSKGLIFVFNSLTGDLCSSFRCSGALSIRVDSKGMLRICKSKELCIFTPDGKLMSKEKVRKEVITDCTNFLLAKRKKMYISTCSDLHNIEIPITGLAVNAYYLTDNYFILCESRGGVTKFDLEKTEVAWSLASPSGHHPICCGYLPTHNYTFVLYAELSELRTSLLVVYDNDSNIIFKADYDACPPVVSFSEYIGGFITGAGECISPSFTRQELRGKKLIRDNFS